MINKLQLRGLLLVLLLVMTAAGWAQPTVTATSPSKNQNNVSATGDISVTFSEAMNQATLTSSTVRVSGSTSGLHAGSIGFNGGGTTATFNPTKDFAAGELVTVVLTTGVQNASDVALSNSFSWNFRTETSTSGDSYSSTNYTSGNGPRDIRIADLDGDGDNDLVAMNYDDDNVSIFKNNGDGTFAAKTNYPLGDNPLFLALSDVDNDGNVDIISTNSFGLSLSVLKNNGNGTFAAKVDYPTPYQSRTVVASDVNGDGFVDLIAPTESKDSVSVFMNNGDGTFADDLEYLTGDGPFGVTVADFDGNGSLDIITSNYASKNISVLLNNSDGTFGAHVDYAAGEAPRGVINADIDNDGDLDIIVANISGISSGSISVLKNNGNGTFAANVDYPVDFGATHPFVQDVDGDGDIDILSANSSASNFSLFKNNGDGTFAAKVDFSNNISSWVFGVAAGDLDGNGTIDLVSGLSSSNQINVMLNVLPPSVTSTNPSLNTTGISTSANVEITFDQAMFSDSLNSRTIVVNGSQSGLHSGSVSYNSGNHTATFDPTENFAVGELVTVTVTTSVLNSHKAGMSSPYVFQFYTYLKGDLLTDQNTKFYPGYRPYSAVHADLDDDGDLDMILPLAEKDSISILTNDGSGNYTTLTQLYSGSGVLPYSISTGDYNKDGSMDFTVANYSSGNVEVFINTGSLTFSRTTYGAQNGTIASVSVDLDGDGDIDIAAYNRNSGTYSIFKNNGNGTFASSANSSVYEYNGNRIQGVDIDGDGDIDLVTSGQAHNINIIKNNGNGTFATPSIVGLNNADDVKFADLDHDGDMDMVSAYQTADQVSVFMNNGDGTFTSGTDFSFNNPTSVAFMDLSYDGDIDIIVSSQDEDFYDQIEYLKNDGSANFIKEYGFYDLQTNSEWSNAGYPSLSTADVDGDGDFDLVMTSRLKSYVAINKSSDYVTVTSLSPAPNAINVTASSNLTATLNYDADPATINSSNVSVIGSLTGKISGSVSYDSPSKTITFDPTSNLKAGETYMFSVSDSVTSLNGTHLYAGRSTEFTVAVSSSGKGHFVSSSTLNFDSNHYPDYLAVGDLNGDGFADAAMIESYNQAVSIALNNGDGTFAAPTALSYSKSSMRYIQIADMDSDGDMDIIIGRNGNSDIDILLNDGSATFETTITYGSFFTYYENLYVKDVNSNGLVDVIQRNSGSSGPVHFENQGDGTFHGDIKQIDWGSSDLAIVDLNKDGNQDFVMSYNQSGYHRLGIALGERVHDYGVQRFGEPYFFDLDIAPNLIQAADFDHDGDVDFVATTVDNLSFFFIKNNGDGTFTTGSPVSLELSVGAMQIGDLNGDGDIDVLFSPSSSNDNSKIYFTAAYNDGNGNFNNTAGFNLPDNSTFKDSKLADADGDGDLDMVLIDGGYVNSNYVVSLYAYGNTTSTVPTTEANTISFKLNFGSKITVEWNKGDGTRHLVVVKAGSAVDATPSDNGNYNPNPVFGEGSDLGGGNYVVYSGAGNSVTISGLTLNTQYSVAIFELNGNEGEEKFYTANAPTGSFTTNSKDGYAFDTTPGTALSFNGSSGIAEYYYDNDLPNDFTISMWVKVTDSSNVAAFFTRGDEQGIAEYKVAKHNNNRVKGSKEGKFSKVSSAGDSEYYYPIKLGINNGHLYASVYDDDNGDPVNMIATSDANNNHWYHVALTMHYDIESEYSSGKFYVNGKEEGSFNDIYYNDYDYSILLGYDGSTYFNGQVDELQIRDKVLTPEEIRSSMHKTLSGFPENLFGYWQFNEGTGTTASQLLGDGTFYFNEGVSWVQSSIPVGEGTTASASSFTSGQQTVGNATLDMADGFDNPVDIVVTEVTGEPNIFPAGYSSTVGGKIFVIELFGDPGTFTASLTLNFGSGVLNETVNENPGQVKLFKRSSTSSGSWTDLGGATSADYVTGDVTWTGITSFSQFLPVLGEPTVPVELSSFNANLSGNSVTLNWTTQTETNNTGWEVESKGTESKEQGAWKKVGFVAGKGTTKEKQSYTFGISGLTGSKVEFRLKQIDSDGNVAYSNILSVDLIPSKFELSQNYPNPFNPTTSIRFSLPVAGHVELSVYNMLGQKILTLVNGEKEAGYHLINLDGRNLASGSYFYVINAGNFHSVKKLMLMK